MGSRCIALATASLALALAVGCGPGGSSIGGGSYRPGARPEGGVSPETSFWASASGANPGVGPSAAPRPAPAAGPDTAPASAPVGSAGAQASPHGDSAPAAADASVQQARELRTRAALAAFRDVWSRAQAPGSDCTLVDDLAQCPLDRTLDAFSARYEIYVLLRDAALNPDAQAGLEAENPGRGAAFLDRFGRSFQGALQARLRDLRAEAVTGARLVEQRAGAVCNSPRFRIVGLSFAEEGLAGAAAVRVAGLADRTIRALGELLAEPVLLPAVCEKLTETVRLQENPASPNRLPRFISSAELAGNAGSPSTAPLALALGQTAAQLREFFASAPSRAEQIEAAAPLQWRDRALPVACDLAPDADGTETRRFVACAQGLRVLRALAADARSAGALQRIRGGASGMVVRERATCPLPSDDFIVASPVRDETERLLRDCPRDEVR